MNDADSNMVAQHLCQAASRQWDAANLDYEAAAERLRPFILYRPRIAKDGDAWIACLGENIQEGVVGIGDSPENAARAFDKAWYAVDEKGKGV